MSLPSASEMGFSTIQYCVSYIINSEILEKLYCFNHDAGKLSIQFLRIEITLYNFGYR